MLKQVHSCTFHHLVCVSVSKSDLLFSILKNIQNGHVKESTEQYHLYLNFFSMMMMMLVRFPFPIFVPSSTISSFFTKNYMSYVTLYLLFIYFCFETSTAHSKEPCKHVPRLLFNFAFPPHKNELNECKERN